MSKPIDLTGKRFGKLVAVRCVGIGKYGRRQWLCRCDCGGEKIVGSSSLTPKHASSCGCAPNHNKTHGMTADPEYWVWSAMIQRCHNPNDAAYDRYGARGITVCDRWRESFANFIQDMGRRPRKGYSVERNENDKGYSPENCRWATAAEQTRNTRRNVWVTLNGRTQCVTDWAIEFGMAPMIAIGRIFRGWDPERALTTPVKHQRKIANVPHPSAADGSTQ